MPWQKTLLAHPDREWVSHLVTGIWEGFRIGLLAHPNYHSIVGKSPSAVAQCKIVLSSLASQVNAGYMIGPFPAHSCTNVVTSCMAVVPKSTQGISELLSIYLRRPITGLRMITNMTIPMSTYSSINEAALLMHYLGKHHDQNRCPRCLQANSNPPHES